MWTKIEKLAQMLKAGISWKRATRGLALSAELPLTNPNTAFTLESSLCAQYSPCFCPRAGCTFCSSKTLGRKQMSCSLARFRAGIDPFSVQLIYIKWPSKEDFILSSLLPSYLLTTAYHQQMMKHEKVTIPSICLDNTL